MNMISFPLSTLFEFPTIKGLTEDFINKNPGVIPVYGGRMTETPIGYISDNIKTVKYFSDCLGWNREGSVGYVFYHKNKFSTNDHHRPLVLKEEYKSMIDLEYVRIVLEQLLLSSGFSWGKTASKEKVRKMSIDLPLDANYNISLQKQKDFVQKYSVYSLAQRKLVEYQKKLENSLVIVENKYSQSTILLSEKCFSLSIGKRVLKKDLLDNGIPVYSANTKKAFGFIEKSNIADFDKDSLIWGIDGNFEWGFIPCGEIFATTDHCGRLIINDNKILSEYVYYCLRESTSLYGFNRSFRASLINIKNVSINIPTKKNGEYDINAQRKMIETYRMIDETKQKLINLIKFITKANIDVLIEK